MQNMPIAIFRGDDTDALGYQTIVGTIKTDLDLTGCKAVFKYLGFSVEFNPIPADKKLTVIIPASETAKFPPGLGYASLRVFDSEGKLCTFSNRIMVFVATKTPMFGNTEFEVDFNVRPELEPLKIFVGPNPDDFDEYRGFLEKVIDRASAAKYGLAMLLDAIDSDLGADDGVAATPAAVKAAYAAVIGKLTDEYYTKDETDEAIDRVAAYYITYDAAGHAFPTHADLANAQTYYSGGKARTPTRNDYAIVLADETQGGAEWRYIYAVADGQTVGQWEPQYPIETNDYAALSNKPQINGNTLTGNKTGANLGLVDASGGRANQLRLLIAATTGSSAGLYSLRVKYDGTTFNDKATLEIVKQPAGSGNEVIVATIDLPATSDTLAFVSQLAAKLDADSGTMTGVFNLNGRLNVNYSDGTAYEIDYYGIRVHYRGGVTKQIYMPNVASFVDGDGYMALVENLAPSFSPSVTYYQDDLVKYNGALYMCIATSHTGAWSNSNFAIASVQGALVRKLGHNGPWVNGYIDVLERVTGESVPYGIRIYRNKIVYGAFTNSTPRGFTPIRQFDLPATGGTLALTSQLDDKLAKSGGTMTGGLTMGGGNLITFSDSSGTRTMTIGLNGDSFEIKLYSYGTLVYTWRTPYNGGVFALASDLRSKLDASSASDPFSNDSSVSYPVGSHCTYQGKLYKCTTATTGGTWVAGSWTADAITDIIPYDRITITTGQLQDHAEQKVTLNAATTTLSLPALTDLTGKVSDFGIDVVNGYEVSGTPTAASFSLAGTLGTDYNLIVPEGEDWSEMSALAAGEMAVYYFTLSAFAINDKPTWEVMKKVVTLVPVPTAP